MSKPQLRIMAVGLRGIPQIAGGVETHAAELYPRLASLGVAVTVLGRKRFRPQGVGSQWRGVRLRWIWAPRLRGLEAAVHTILGVLYAAVRRPHLLHIHAVGPSIAVPLAKLLGLRVIVTHHGQDYLREKWGTTERWLIRLGERFAMRFADALICVSPSLRTTLLSQYGRDTSWIPNGVGAPQSSTDDHLLAKYQLTRGRYVIQVSRLVPEKRQLDLIQAFRAARLPDWKLVLVGGGQGAEDYARAVISAARADSAIVCTGSLLASEAQALLSDAGVFVLPSSHEGMPIALLEAIALSVPALASDIPANRDIGLEDDYYFAVGDIAGLTQRMQILTLACGAHARAVERYPAICRRFDWEKIASETLTVMSHIAARRGGGPHTGRSPMPAPMAVMREGADQDESAPTVVS